jgi:hypothetical protein
VKVVARLGLLGEFIDESVDTPHGDGLLVIHVMPLREKYRPHYEEAKRWRR